MDSLVRQSGKRHREKVGRKSAAVKLYAKRKTDALEVRKLPVLRNTKGVTVSGLVDLTLEATANRYKALISLCHRQAMRNGKVPSNPARLVQQQKESAGRLRYLTREEYNRVCEAIRNHFPEHLPEFIVSVNTGMRLTEQYSCTWSQVDDSRRAIGLTATKNGTARTNHLNADALAAIESVRQPGQKPTDRVFTRQGANDRFDIRSWFAPCLAGAKITGYVWYSNRHTLCSWLAMAGATIKEIQELAGHKAITRAARYAHLSPDHKLLVIDRIAATATNSH